jgi:hypothetical protein
MSVPPTPKNIEKKIEIKEGKPEKVEKFEHKELKFEKAEKNEFKEHKNEFKEHKHEKIEIKEVKIEKNEHKEFKVEIKEHSKLEIKEHGEKGIPKEKDGKELVEGGHDHVFDPIRDLAAAKQHLASLEDAVKNMQHFIDNAERPDLGKGALKNEKGGKG